MLWSLVKNTPWEPLLKLVSPTFFDVVPGRMLFSEMRGLSSRYLSASTYKETCAARQEALERARLPFTIVAKLPAPVANGPDVSDEERGNDLLTLYFHQVLGDGPVLLDMRRSAFARGQDGWQWKPEPAIAIWTEDFRAGCRALYEGFYRNDPARFSAGAEALGLGKAEAELRAQFGDTHAVKFSMREFQARFQQVFQRCKETHSQIHPGFLTLGLALATLYEHLESIGIPLDVDAAFDRAQKARRI